MKHVGQVVHTHVIEAHGGRRTDKHYHDDAEYQVIENSIRRALKTRGQKNGIPEACDEHWQDVTVLPWQI